MPVINDPLAILMGEWSAQINIYTILLRIGISMLFSAFIGIERSSKRHSAGLRTFIIVSLAGTLAMLTDIFLMCSTQMSIPVISAAAIIGGAMISGNSVLYSSKSQIKGLTTSAALWACGVIGLTAGAGMYTVTAVAFVAVICGLSLFPTIEHGLKDRFNHFEIHLELKNKSNLQDFVTTIRQLGMVIDNIESNPAYINSGLSVYTVSVTINGKELKKYKKHSEIIQALSTLEYVYHIEEME